MIASSVSCINSKGMKFRLVIDVLRDLNVLGPTFGRLYNIPRYASNALEG